MSPSGLQADAYRALSDWRPSDADQRELRGQYLAHLDAYDNAMLRECRFGHVTASSLIVDATRESVLLTLHPIVGRWLQTGGHCESDDTTLMGAAHREATEESGIDDLRIDAIPLRLDRHAVRCRPATGDPTVLDHLDVQFLALAPAYAQETRTQESLDLRWWHWARLPDGIDASVRNLVAAARERCTP
ncbi:MAG: NUDIX hydrolase [Actinomycetota bacterium]